MTFNVNAQEIKTNLSQDSTNDIDALRKIGACPLLP